MLVSGRLVPDLIEGGCGSMWICSGDVISFFNGRVMEIWEAEA